MTDWSDGDYIDGPEFAQWLVDEGLFNPRAPTEGGRDNQMIDPTLIRAIWRWRSGARASLEAIDRWMTEFERHISELPDHMWKRGSIYGPRKPK